MTSMTERCFGSPGKCWGASRAKGRGQTSPLWAGSLPTSAHGALQDRWPHPVDPRDPSGGPGTIPVTPKLVPMAEIALPIYNSLPPDHFGTPRDVQDLIRDSEQLSVTTYNSHYNSSVTEPLVCRPYGFGNHADMTKTSVRPVTNSRIWIPILAPTCSTMISLDESRCREFR